MQNASESEREQRRGSCVVTKEKETATLASLSRAGLPGNAWEAEEMGSYAHPDGHIFDHRCRRDEILEPT